MKSMNSRRVGAPYRRVRIPGSSDLRVCVLSANKVILYIKLISLLAVTLNENNEFLEQ